AYPAGIAAMLIAEGELSVRTGWGEMGETLAYHALLFGALPAALAVAWLPFTMAYAWWNPKHGGAITVGMSGFALAVLALVMSPAIWNSGPALIGLVVGLTVLALALRVTPSLQRCRGAQGLWS
ncbi:MAG TPA: hypothetical protein VF665_02715, partial [Longimicrobium sp.]|uniref:hypothetical protein n=1 Tax=Longimicrobium sp. TaxID=2029185 RepID=UPI002EDB02A5